MTQNKSIDGLSTRVAKKTASKSSTTKTIKSTKTTKTTTKAKPARATKSAKSTTKPSTTAKSHVTNTEKTEFDLILDSESIVETPLDSSTIESTTNPTQSTSTQAQDATDFLTPVAAFDFDADTKQLTAIDPDQLTDDSNISDSDNTDDDTDSLLDQPKPKKSKKAKKKPGKIRKAITIILLIIVLGLIAAVTWLVFWGNDIIAKITGGQGNLLDLFTFVDETYEPLKTDQNGRTNILAFGTSGFDMSGEEYGGVHDGAALTDSIMIISLNQDTGDVVMLSLPRDLKVPYSCGYTYKVNEVYWCNNMDDDNEQAGGEALMEAVGTILGLDFQYYAHLNWGSLESIVDTLGGITITLDEDIFDYGWTDAVYEAGVPYTINGIEAVALSRARHGTIGGDFSRGASQQKILIGIKDRVFEKQFSITELVSLASTLGDNLRTNFSISDFKTLAHLTKVFDFNNIRQISLVDYNTGIYYVTTGMIGGISYVIPSAGDGNYHQIQALIAEQTSNDPRIYETPTILVLNATDTPGLASLEQANLIADGYTTVDADNAPAGDYLTGITLYAVNNDKPGTQRLLEDYYEADTISADQLPAEVSRDYDFIIIINPTTEPATE